MDIKKLANSLVKKHETKDPFQIARDLGYIVIYAPLMGIRGYHQYKWRSHIICISNDLDEPDARFVCAHELGHCLLHKEINRIFLDTRTHFVSSIFEKDADHFAVDLIFDDYELQDLLETPLPNVSQCLGISYELAEYRMGSVSPVLYQV